MAPTHGEVVAYRATVALWIAEIHWFIAYQLNESEMLYLTIESFGFVENGLNCPFLILVDWSKGKDTTLSR